VYFVTEGWEGAGQKRRGQEAERWTMDAGERRENEKEIIYIGGKSRKQLAKGWKSDCTSKGRNSGKKTGESETRLGKKRSKSHGARENIERAISLFQLGRPKRPMTKRHH